MNRKQLLLSILVLCSVHANNAEACDCCLQIPCIQKPIERIVHKVFGSGGTTPVKDHIDEKKMRALERKINKRDRRK